MVDYNELTNTVVGRAIRDRDFRDRLLADPHAAIEEAVGHAVPRSVSFRVVERQAHEHYLVLPPRDGEELIPDTEEPPFWHDPDDPDGHQGVQKW